MRKVVIAGMIGNGLEWYDYALYGLVAAIIGQHFFPSDDKLVSLIATYGVFAAGFIMRPVGAVVFGYIGDTFGRKIALSASILLMAIPTACIGLLPDYASIGIFAPILLTVLRLLQGLALGGELSGSIVYVVEHAPPHRRGIAGGSSFISMMIGVLCGSATVALMTEAMGEEAFKAWGWRIPFVIGLVIGLVGFYIRSFLDESPTYEDAKANGHISTQPFKETLTHHWRSLVMTVLIYLAVTLPFYVLVIFMSGYLSQILHYPLEQATLSNTGALFVLLLCLPVSALLSDRIGRKPVLIATAIGYILLAYPAFSLIVSGNIMYAFIGQCILAVLVGFYISPIPALLVEVFPTSVRYTGMALACNVSAAVFGGTAPAVVTWFIQMTDMPIVVAFYVIASAVGALIALYFYKETYRSPLA